MIEVDARVGASPLPSLASHARSRAWIGAWWLGGRGLVLLATVVVHYLGPVADLRQTDRAHVLGLLSSWDGRWYRIVASDGYLLVPGRQSDPAFFPLYPVLLRAVHAFGLGYATAGIVIANLGFLVALVAFDALTADLLGDALARRATVYLAIFPFGYAFSMAYPESIVLAAMVLAALAALRGRWGIAAVCAAAAALARPEGLFVALPLLAIMRRQHPRLSPARRGVAYGSILAPGAALAAYPLYLDRILHDPTAWTQAERQWGRHFSVLGVVHAVDHLGKAVAGNGWVMRDVVAAVLYLALLLAAARAGTPRSWLAAGTAVVVLPLFSGSFVSMGRFGLLAVPVFWGLAWVGRRPRVDLAVRAVSLTLLAASIVTVPMVFP
jgi:hypothetical protein